MESPLDYGLQEHTIRDSPGTMTHDNSTNFDANTNIPFDNKLKAMHDGLFAVSIPHTRLFLFIFDFILVPCCSWLLLFLLVF